MLFMYIFFKSRILCVSYYVLQWLINEAPVQAYDQLGMPLLGHAMQTLYAYADCSSSAETEQ